MQTPRGQPPEPLLDIREALDRVHDGFIVYDREWRFLYLNRSAEAYFARPREELIGRIVWEVFPAAVGSEAEQGLRRASERREPSELELFAPAMQRWVAFRVFPSDHGVSISFRDVSEIRKTTAELRASEAWHRAVFDHALDGMLLTSPSGEILAANEAACRMLGRTEEEIRAAGRAGVMDPSDPHLEPALEERRRTGRVRGELTCFRSDGSRFPVEVSSAIFRDDEGRERTSMTLRDLTERKHAEDRWRLVLEAGVALGSSLELEATLRALTRTVVPGMADLCMVDLVEGDTIRRVAVSHRDPSREPALADLGTPRPVPVKQAGAYKVARTGEAELVPVVDDDWLRAATRDDEHLAAARAATPRSAVIVPIPGRTGVLGVLMLFVTDGTNRYDALDLDTARAVADRAGLAIENARLHEQTVQAIRLRDEVVGIVSHDLRNPLNAIALMARILGRKTDAPELETITRAVRRADRLIQDLLTVTALEAGGMPLEKSRVPLAPLVDEAVGLHLPAAVERSIAIEAAVEAGLPDVEVDRHRTLQVLGNLLDNALKFTPEGGSVRVEVHRNAGSLAVSVSDTGPGIAPAAMPHIFDRFWQVAETRRAGAGLGLAIAKGIVEAQGGTLSVHSEPGRGATFTFTVPIATSPT